MIKITDQLHHWFAENNIPTDGLTMVLNFQDSNAAVRFDAALRKELGALMMPAETKLDLHKEFEMNGIKVLIESPAHS